MKPMLDIDLLNDCRKAIRVKPTNRLVIGDQVMFSDRKLPGRWVYTGESFVRPKDWNAPKPLVDYGVRPNW